MVSPIRLSVCFIVTENWRSCAISATKTIKIGWISAFFEKKVVEKFVSSEKSITFAPAIKRGCLRKAEIAQLVEHNLAKVGVAGPSPVFRSLVEQKRDIKDWP